MSSDEKRRKPNYYAAKKRKQFNLEPGLKGFICSCNFRERECIREAYSILNEHYEQLCAPKADAEGPEAAQAEEDVEDALAKELKAEREDAKRKRFQIVESGAKNFLFIRTSVEDPVGLVRHIFEHVVATKQQIGRYLLRLMPIEATCRADMEDIKATARKLFARHFAGEPATFAIIYNHRNNDNLNRDAIIKELADIVVGFSDKHKAHLKDPKLAVIVEVIRAVCLLSVVPDYFRYKKYNLLQLCEKPADAVTPTEEKNE